MWGVRNEALSMAYNLFIRDFEETTEPYLTSKHSIISYIDNSFFISDLNCKIYYKQGR